MVSKNRFLKIDGPEDVLIGFFVLFTGYYILTKDYYPLAILLLIPLALITLLGLSFSVAFIGNLIKRLFVK